MQLVNRFSNYDCFHWVNFKHGNTVLIHIPILTVFSYNHISMSTTISMNVVNSRVNVFDNFNATFQGTVLVL